MKLQLDLDKVEKKDLFIFISELERSDRSQWLKHDYKVSLKKFYKWYYKEENPELTKWIKTTVKKKDQKLPEEMLTKIDILNLIEHAEHERDKAMIALLWDIGARIGEIGTLHIKQIAFDEHGAIINVNGKTGYRRVRAIWSIEYLKAWLQIHPEGYNPDAPLWVTLKSKENLLEPLQYGAIRMNLQRIAKYDSVIYQIVLICFNSIFCLDKYGRVESVVINGKLNTIDKATGNHIKPYILSISVKKEDFKTLNLSSIDPKALFKSAKGIAVAKLSIVTPVPPVIVLNKEDRRFIEGYEVIDNLEDSMNLATMDWQDFENLIREPFEWEFSTNGGEVKITQTIRDKGVDAVAFDPDPIKGGKIVIQAKRYTNVVGVSAVRDLYGTIMNEGANKGILVSTSNYGNDAYEFAKDKPITLLNGANLLYLLEKHGHKARIDIKEAKKQLNAK